MSGSSASHYDAVILGAGAAGSWTFAALKALGFRVLLLTRDSLGGRQTDWCQGIIHNGSKYSQGPDGEKLTRALAAVQDSWRASLAGTGQPDLRRVEVLSEQNYLWTAGRPDAALAAQLHRLEQRRLARRLGDQEYPAAFANPDFGGTLLEVPEPVINPTSLVTELTREHLAATAKLPADADCRFQATDDGMLVAIERRLFFVARRLVFAAGSGNIELMRKAGFAPPEVQLRPAHQVLLRLPGRHGFYGHFLREAPPAGPALTVTTKQFDGYSVLQLGGELAEAGVGRGRHAQLRAAAGLVREALPWLDLAGAEWSSELVNRVEPATGTGGRPDGALLERHGACLLFWPVKMTLAPLAARLLAADLGTPLANPAKVELQLPQPAAAAPPEAGRRCWMRP